VVFNLELNCLHLDFALFFNWSGQAQERGNVHCSSVIFPRHQCSNDNLALAGLRDVNAAARAELICFGTCCSPAEPQRSTGSLASRSLIWSNCSAAQFPAYSTQSHNTRTPLFSRCISRCASTGTQSAQHSHAAVLSLHQPLRFDRRCFFCDPLYPPARV